MVSNLRMHSEWADHRRINHKFLPCRTLDALLRLLHKPLKREALTLNRDAIRRCTSARKQYTLMHKPMLL